MLALNSYVYIQKSSLHRCVSGIAAVMSKARLETFLRHQNLVKTPSELGSAEFHSSSAQSRDLLMKMIAKKKKKKWYEPRQVWSLRNALIQTWTLTSSQSFLAGQSGFLTPTKKKTQEDTLRVRTLNIIVYKAITDLLASHEVNADLTKCNVEITKVSFTADFCSCRVYWNTSWLDGGEIQQVLDKCAPRVRYLLMSLQILSNVPPLVFVRDKKFAALKEVEDLLKIVDYGPSEDSGNLSLDGKVKTTVHSVEPLDMKRPLWFGIDHDALHKQIEDYKQRSRDTYSESTSSTGLTQEQLDMLAEIRKQKLIEKKKRKSKKLKDEDITPLDFLLARQLREEEQENEYSKEHSSEDNQISELMADYERKH